MKKSTDRRKLKVTEAAKKLVTQTPPPKPTKAITWVLKTELIPENK